MELIKLGKKGQVTIPKNLLKQVGISDEMPLLAEATGDGAIVLRQAGVYPIEIYSEDRLQEFEQINKVPDSLRQRVDSASKKAGR